MKFFLYICFAFLLPSFLQAEVLDDFTDIKNHKYVDSFFGFRNLSPHVHKRFKNSNGENVEVSRWFKSLDDDTYTNYVNDTQFTLEPNKLHFDASVTTKNATHCRIQPNEIQYALEHFCDMTNTPKIKINFSNFSQPFLMNIHLGDAWGKSRYINDITINSLNPTINITDNFSDSFDFESLDLIAFIMNTGKIPDLKFDISSIEIVPEPISMISLSTGILTFIRKRKSKKSYGTIN